MERILPVLPGVGKRIPLIIDSDAANEIDDLYAIALALVSEDRFDLRGFVATHFAATDWAGPESIEESRRCILEVMAAAGMAGRYPVWRGGHPMQYQRIPSPSEGCDFILREARAATPEEPLWVLALGAATNLASALLTDPSIVDRVRFIFHARSEYTWPERTEQYNVKGDVLAVMHLLTSGVPLVWFDTGTHLTASMAETEKRLAPLGPLGRYLHAYREKNPYFRGADKGFFDLGDVAWLLDPTLCQTEEVPVMRMDHALRFYRARDLGTMLRVRDIRTVPTWELLYRRLGAHAAKMENS